MATDSATFDRRAATSRRAADAPAIQSPAAPIARGMGLDRPFFDDKNRAFWILQSTGWGGYFILRSLSGFANSMGAMYVVHTALAKVWDVFRAQAFSTSATIDGTPIFGWVWPLAAAT